MKWFKGGESTMTKTDLIDKVADKTGLTKKDSGEAVNAVFEAMVEFLAEESKKAEADRDKVQIIGFGSFEVKIERLVKDAILVLVMRLRFLRVLYRYLKLAKL